MKINIQKNKFLKAIENNLKIVDHASMTIELRCLLFDVRLNKIIIKSSNGEISIQNEYELDGINNKADSTGVFLVSAKQIKGVLNRTDENVEITVVKGNIKISSNSYISDFATIDSTNFPDINFTLSSNYFKLGSHDFFKALKNVGYIALNNPSREEIALNVVRIDCKDKKLEFLSSDRKRIAHETIDIDYDHVFDLSFHYKTLKDLLSLNYEKEINFYPGSFEAKILTGKMVVTAKIVTLATINLSQNNPFTQEFHSFIKIDKSELLDLIDKVTVFTDSMTKKIRLKTSRKNNEAFLKLETYIDDAGNSEASTNNIIFEGPEFTALYNANYVKEAMSPFGETVHLFFAPNNGPLMIRSDEYPTNKQLIASIKDH
ncbi:DNA polymerase-3 subunit beta [Mycoplasma testudineum]|uniref:DNA polymerase-3 subunit beta n=1 Tax=Mycoplasma testudineum TaxID=244584 RepID=A0A4R6IDT3_9MOLU|nr:hypothetical protein [Mycoplasma testudineum]OYD26730.1 hypothetical protein CG473_02130 [Mycoplasma testudineum]TDO19866.1 DNA polymerase-3 subunit beta [Mycoplasma testudineum]